MCHRRIKKPILALFFNSPAPLPHSTRLWLPCLRPCFWLNPTSCRVSLSALTTGHVSQWWHVFFFKDGIPLSTSVTHFISYFFDRSFSYHNSLIMTSVMNLIEKKDWLCNNKKRSQCSFKNSRGAEARLHGKVRPFASEPFLRKVFRVN